MAENWIDLLGRDLDRLAARDPLSHPVQQLLPGERREIAVLFLDLAGFTALSEKLDHETLHRISTGVMRALSSRVEADGGIVDRFEGDRMMALFGSTVCSENDCVRAVACALRLIDSLKEISSVMEKHGFNLSGRVGLNYGPVTLAPDPSGHLTVLGDEVNVASRLEQAAEPGTALATSRVREECGDLFEWEDLGEMMIRGRVKPVRTYRIAGPGRLQTARIRKASRLPEPVLTGRSAELAVFSDFLATPLDPPLNPRGGVRHRLCLIGGDAGSGKSRLLRELVATVRMKRPGISILEGRVFPFGSRPYSYWTSLLSSPSVAEGQGFPDPSQLLSMLKGRVTDAGDMAFSHEDVCRAIRDYVLNASKTAGEILFVADDCQWLDQASMDALEFTLANCDSPEGMVALCAGRPSGESEASRPSVHENYAAVCRIDLNPMPDKDICSILASMLDYDSCDELSEDLRRFVVRRAGGNPRFAREILLDLIETGVMEETGGGWLLRSPPEEGRIPLSLSGAVRSRIDRLPTRLRKALQISAVLGFEFPADIYASTAVRLGQSDPATDLKDLASLGILSRQIVDGVETVLANDELSMKAAYDGLLFQNRTLVHKCAAEVLVASAEIRQGEAGMVARHLSGAGDYDEASRWAVRAALEASESMQHGTAAKWASNALKWLKGLPDGEEKTTLRLEALRIIRESFKGTSRCEGLEEALLEEIELAREMEMPGRAGMVLQILSRLKLFQGKADEAESLCAEGLAAAAVAGDTELEAALLTEKALQWTRSRTEAIELFKRAYSLFEKTGRVDAMSKVYNNIGTILISSGNLAGAEPFLNKALTLVEGTRFPGVKAQALVKLGILDGMSGRSDSAIEKLQAALALQESTGERRDQGVTLNNLGKCFIDTGDFDGAKRVLRQALMIHRETGSQVNEGKSLENLGCIYLRDGDLNRARLHLEDSLRLFEAVRYPYGRISSGAFLGMVEAEAGSIDAAVALYGTVLSITIEMKIAYPASEPLKELRDLLIRKGVPEGDVPLPPGCPPD